MLPKLPENLCTSCGLCCDGSLFAEVELKNRRESFNLESFGLEVEENEDGEMLIQPCGALKGTRCGIYAFRPRCCRTFECRLLRDVDDGKRTVAEALEVILGTRSLILEIVATFGSEGRQENIPLKERYFAALERFAGRETEKSAKLRDAMGRLERRIEANFLK